MLTTLYQWAWVFKFLDAAQMTLAGAIFLVFPRRRRRPGTRAPQRSGLAGGPKAAGHGGLRAALPLLFTLYLAAVPGCGARFGILFGLLFLIDVGLLAISLARREFLLHLAGGLGTLVSLVAWLAQSYSSAAWPGVLAVVAVFFSRLPARRAARFGARGARPTLRSDAPRSWRRSCSWPFPRSSRSEPAALRPLPLFGTAFVLLGLAAGAAITRKRGTLYYVAVFFVLVAQAAWSARYLAPRASGHSTRPLPGLRARLPRRPRAGSPPRAPLAALGGAPCSSRRSSCCFTWPTTVSHPARSSGSRSCSPS